MYYSLVCGDTGINKLIALTAVKKNTHNAQCLRIIKMNVTECHWFMCILYYTFMYTMYIFLIIKKKSFP